MLRRSSQNIGRNIGSYLPDMITEMWEPARDFASLKLPSAGVRSLVALNSSIPQVIVVTSEGFFYLYNIDLENGGECVLLKQHRYEWQRNCLLMLSCGVTHFGSFSLLEPGDGGTVGN